ncbi:MAG: TrkA family potassium uptake protein [Candidatus Nanohaloarchaea archaeon]|nr:TrkA family potassium uptake protein [Candidatus Nanohaloarchaea archaeon]
MYVIVAGVNTISKKLIEDMVQNHDLVVVEEDEAKAERVYSTGATVVNGNPTNLSVLEDAGISKADVLVTVLGEPNQNLVVSMLGKKYGVPKIVSRVEDTNYLDIYNMLEVNTIEYTDIVYAEFISVIEHPSMRKIANVGTDKEIIELVVGEGSRLKDMRIDEVKSMKRFPRKEVEFSAVLRGDNVHDPEDTFRLKTGDSVIVIIDPHIKGRLNDILG